MKEALSFAHGRVNLIGEHTDYNGGWVLPTAIPQQTTVRLSRLDGSTVELHAGVEEAGGAARSATYELGQEKARGDWADYLQGATSLLAKSGIKLGGFKAEISSTVPEGSGLSSSAALEVAFLKGLRSLFGFELTDEAIAILGQRIENEFVGARVGIMDQMACAFGKWGEALFLDTQSMQHRSVVIPLGRADLVVINSGVKHRHCGGGYNQRREECEAACAELKIKSLRELHPDGLDRLNSLPDTLLRRARHVVTENIRVLETVKAFECGDLPTAGQLFYASHASMRDDYEVSVPEVDLLVSLLGKEAGVYGARLTGGGFGGSVVALTRKGEGRAIAERVALAYGERTGLNATVLIPGR
ncbi:MAG: galactokinase [Proteobacteria bacterium]|nr:MAG: galactokinase [Pseudomonadota bacterium]